MNITKVVSLAITVLVVALFSPIAFNALLDADEPTVSESFVAEEDDVTEEVIQLENFPVVTDSETVEVNEVEITKPDQYTIDDEAGEITIDEDDSNTGDDIDVEYTYERYTGTLGIVFGILPVLLGIGLIVGVVVFIRGVAALPR